MITEREELIYLRHKTAAALSHLQDAALSSDRFARERGKTLVTTGALKVIMKQLDDYRTFLDFRLEQLQEQEAVAKKVKTKTEENLNG